MRGHSGGSHNAQAKPDEKMGHAHWPNVSQKKADKRTANKKRRQHAAKVIKENV